MANHKTEITRLKTEERQTVSHQTAWDDETYDAHVVESLKEDEATVLIIDHDDQTNRLSGGIDLAIVIIAFMILSLFLDSLFMLIALGLLVGLIRWFGWRRK